MSINQQGKLKVATANSVYHLGEVDADGSRTVMRDGCSLEFERGVLLGPFDSSFLGAQVDKGKPLVTGRGMSIMPVPSEDRRVWNTSPLRSIENE